VIIGYSVDIVLFHDPRGYIDDISCVL